MRAHFVPATATMAAVLLTATAPAHARDRNGYHAIAAGDFAAAERRLEVERRIFPDRAELLLNLAHVYRHTGRAAQARALYARVLAQPLVELDLPSGAIASSHELASLGLATLSAHDIAAR